MRPDLRPPQAVWTESQRLPVRRPSRQEAAELRVVEVRGGGRRPAIPPHRVRRGTDQVWL